MHAAQFRQGDVLLIRARQMPPGAEALSHGERIILAWGEATGHAHAVSAASAEIYSALGARYLKVNVATQLTHEEHAPIALSPGVYKVVRQREYLPRGGKYVDD